MWEKKFLPFRGDAKVMLSQITWPQGKLLEVQVLAGFSNLFNPSKNLFFCEFFAFVKNSHTMLFFFRPHFFFFCNFVFVCTCEIVRMLLQREKKKEYVGKKRKTSLWRMSAERHLLKEALVHVPFLGITLVHVAWIICVSAQVLQRVQFTWCLRTLRSQAWKACLVTNLNIRIFLALFFFFHTFFLRKRKREKEKKKPNKMRTKKYTLLYCLYS
jgi:hypothetical protein